MGQIIKKDILIYGRGYLTSFLQLLFQLTNALF